MSKQIGVLLVTEHEKTFDALFNECRRAGGCHVEQATSLAGGLDKVAEEDYDIIVCAVGLQDGSGLDLAKAAIGKNGATKVVAVSHDATMHKLALQAGCVAGTNFLAAARTLRTQLVSLRA